MSQAALITPSGTGLEVRSDINAAIARLATRASGTARPVDIAIGEEWIETDNPGSGIWTLWRWDGASDIFSGLIDAVTHKFTPPSVLTTPGGIIYRGASADQQLAPGDDFSALFSGSPPSWQGTWKLLGIAEPVGAGAVDFTGFSAWVRNIALFFELLPSTNAVIPQLQTYNAGGTLDTGASDYIHVCAGYASNGGAVVSALNTSQVDLIPRDTNRRVSNNGSVGGIAGCIKAFQITESRYTRFTFDTTYGPDADSNFYWRVAGSGTRIDPNKITGVRLKFSAGNMSGRVHIYGGK